MRVGVEPCAMLDIVIICFSRLHRFLFALSFSFVSFVSAGEEQRKKSFCPEMLRVA
jgi:hypothetical protein